MKKGVWSFIGAIEVEGKSGMLNNPVIEIAGAAERVKSD